MESRLAGIKAKLDRAEQQIQWGNTFPAAWTAAKEPWALKPEIDEGKRRYIYTFWELEQIPPVFPVICDEIIHHLRSVLDHLACHLVEACGGKETNSTAWPIKGSAWKWRCDVERRRKPWQVWRKEGGGPLAGIPIGSPIWTFIEDAQPYSGGGKARDDPLFALDKTWNANKHRVLNARVLYFFPEGDPLDLFDVEPFIEPVESRWLFGGKREAEDGAPTALFRFPEDRPLPKMRVKVDAEISFEIGIGDGKGPSVNFEKTLGLIRDLVAKGAALAEAEQSP
jgi:hypothetical protein